MAQAVANIFDAPVPAHIAAAMGEEGAGNIVARATVNALTFEGKVWSINLDGKKTKLMRTNADGEEEPVSIFTGIVLDYAKDRGREWYAKAYDPKNPTIPDCWSEDSKTPHPNVPTPAAKTCASCPNARKGSAQTADGNPTVACGQFQKLAVIPASKIGAFPPLRLRLKITSIYDKAGVDKHPGWHAFQQYIDHLVSKGISVTYAMPTKIKFDPAVAYPKLLFAPGKDWLDADTFAVVKAMAQDDAVKELMGQSYDPAASNTGTKPLPDDEEDVELPAAPQPAQARAAKPVAKAASQPAPAEDEDENGEATADEDEDEPAPPAPPAPKPRTTAATATAANAAAVAKAAQKAAAVKAAPADDYDEDATTVMPPVKTAKLDGQSNAKLQPAVDAVKAAKANGKTAPAAAPAPKGTLNAPAEVADLMQDWDD